MSKSPTFTLGGYFLLGRTDAALTLLLQELLDSDALVPNNIATYRVRLGKIVTRLHRFLEPSQPLDNLGLECEAVLSSFAILACELPPWLGGQEHREALKISQSGPDGIGVDHVWQHAAPFITAQHAQGQLRQFIQTYGNKAWHGFGVGYIIERLLHDLGWCPNTACRMRPQTPTRLDESCLRCKDDVRRPCHLPEEHVEMLRGYAEDHLKQRLPPVRTTRQQYDQRKDIGQYRRCHDYEDVLLLTLRDWATKLNEILGKTTVHRKVERFAGQFPVIVEKDKVLCAGERLDLDSDAFRLVRMIAERYRGKVPVAQFKDELNNLSKARQRIEHACDKIGLDVVRLFEYWPRDGFRWKPELKRSEESDLSGRLTFTAKPPKA